jgi:PhzF family phenazine biosynthesis protein
MKLPFYWVDAFASRAFTGNPAGVIPLDEWLPDAVLQNIAFENGLPMTAFFVRQAPAQYHLRWFHTDKEAEICGHATLATAFTLFTELGQTGDRIGFETRAGQLAVTRQAAATGTASRFQLDFPSRPSTPVAPANHPTALLNALGGSVREVHRLGTRDYFVAVYERADEVRTLQPDLAALAALGDTRVIVTAPGEDCDFVSRYFSPGAGLPEDAVTGSAHCTLVPYWAARLGRMALHARQLSARGGELWCELAGNRVRLAGHATLYLRGEITV